MTGKKTMLSSVARRLPLLLGAVMAIALSAFAAVPAQSQEIAPEQLDLARKYLELTDRSGVFELEVAQAGINTESLLVQQNPAVADQIHTAALKVADTYKDRKAELFDQVARVYAIVFSKEELEAIVAFYGSPAGQKLSRANAQLNTTIQQVVTLFRGNLNAEFLPKVKAELKTMGVDL